VKRVLVLAYFFPPLGGGGCQRTLKLVRYLEPHGWSASVITTKDEDYWILDRSLLEEVPPSTEVTRVGGLTSLRLLRLLGRGGRTASALQEKQGARDRATFRRLRSLQSWVLVPDGYLPWARAAERAALDRLAAGGVDALWTTSSPESAHLAGLGVKRRHPALPWVADFRDPWVGRVTYAPPTPWHAARHEALERAVVSAADRVTVVSEPMADLYRARYRDLPAGRFEVLPNGVDSDDWSRADALLASATRPGDRASGGAVDAGKFVILHAGQLAHRPTARTLLDAARRVVEADPSAREELRLRFLGGNEELASSDWTRRGLDGIVEIVPSKPHLEAMAAMRRAQVLVLLGHGGEADGLLYTGKIYEYATSGRPVIGIVDPGPAASLLSEMKAGPVLRSADVEGAAAAIREGLAAWRTLGRTGPPPPPSPPAPLAGSWERRNLAQKAAQILENLPSGPHR
jgi:glycosyltransferase involved in cell wall biosynthesis